MNANNKSKLQENANVIASQQQSAYAFMWMLTLTLYVDAYTNTLYKRKVCLSYHLLDEQ